MNYTDHKLFLFGGKPGIAEEAKKKLLEEYTDLNIVGTRNGYFKPEEEAEIVEEINNSGADIVFVCLGAPKQEQWVERNRDALKVRVAMGIGGSLDVFALEKLNAHLKYSVNRYGMVLQTLQRALAYRKNDGIA